MLGFTRRRRPLGLVSLVVIVVLAAAGVVSTAVPAAAVASPENLLAASGTSIVWDSRYVGAISPPNNRITWPTMIYNYSTYSAVSVGTSYTAQDINANTNNKANCNTSWLWVQILCDSPTYDDSLYYVAKQVTPNVGFTIDSNNSTVGYVVVDLGSTQSFNTLNLFQMFSDGKVTQASLYTHAESSSSRPSYDDTGWQLAAQAPIGAGLKISNSLIACPTVINLGSQSSRYVQLRFKNSGEFGSASWIEVGGVKLFNIAGTMPANPETCPPEPPTNAIATAGIASAGVSWTPGIGTVSGWGLQKSSNGGSTWTSATTDPATVPLNATSTTVTGLSPGTQYIFRVRALSSIPNGNSPYTPPSNAVTPSLPPPAVASVSPASGPAAGGTDVTISGTGFVSGATVSFGGVAAASAVVVDDTTITATTPAHADGRVDIVVTNPDTQAGTGAGLFSFGSPAPPSPVPPGPPGDVTAVPGNASATVVWSPPGESGSYPVSSYQVVASPGGASCMTTALTCTVRGLSNGVSYTFTVTALSGAGWGSPSTSSPPVTPSAAPVPAPDPVPVPPLPPGTSQLVVNGVPQQVTVDPNGRDNGLRIEGDGFSMDLQGLGDGGTPLDLAPDGALILNSDRQVQTSGTGFLSTSDVDLYLDPPTLLTSAAARWARADEGLFVGTVTTNAAGSFSGRVTLPGDVSVGDHVLQAVGRTQSGATRALSLGVRVLAPATITLVKGSRVHEGQHDRITASGASTGIAAGTKLTPFIKYSGRSQFEQGKASITVQPDGTFTWTRKIKTSKDLRAYVAWGPTQSNRVTWLALR